MLTPPTGYLSILELEHFNKQAQQSDPNNPNAGAQQMLNFNTSPQMQGLVSPLQVRQAQAQQFGNALSRLGQQEMAQQ